jgi:hypothetical protein
MTFLLFGLKLYYDMSPRKLERGRQVFLLGKLFHLKSLAIHRKFGKMNKTFMDMLLLIKYRGKSFSIKDWKWG